MFINFALFIYQIKNMISQTRRAREKVEMRQLIIDTAIKMYLEDGFEKLTLRGITSRIEYSVGTIYLYFKDKDELFHAMHEWAFEKLLAEFESLSVIENPLERLKGISNIYIAFAFKNPELYDLMFIKNEPMCAHANLEDWLCGKRTFDFFNETVHQCLEKGLIKGESAEIMSFMFWSSTHGMIALHLRSRLRMYEEFNVEQLILQTESLILSQFLTGQ